MASQGSGFCPCDLLPHTLPAWLTFILPPLLEVWAKDLLLAVSPKVENNIVCLKAPIRSHFAKAPNKDTSIMQDTLVANVSPPSS